MWISGLATHYGPFPILPHFSEIGYQLLDVGVGCSNGQPGGDPRWNKILNDGVYDRDQMEIMANINGSSLDSIKRQNLDLLSKSIWPKSFTVAVSERAYGGSNKVNSCFQTLQIRNSKNHSLIVNATIVDFCPTNGCLWPLNQVSRNLDLYGQALWTALGAQSQDSKVEIDVLWPSNLIPNSANIKYSRIIVILEILYIFGLYSF